MINERTRRVKPEDERPAQPDGRCFHCGRPVGQHHRDACVVPEQTVIVQFTYTALLKVPACWKGHDIDFYYNESSWCASSMIGILEEEEKRGSCACRWTSAEFVREATPQDEMDHNLG